MCQDNTEVELLWGAKLALIQAICQTREGAKFVIQNNIFRAIDLSGLFAADPELEISSSCLSLSFCLCWIVDNPQYSTKC